MSSCHRIRAHGIRKGGSGGATWRMRDASSSRVVRVQASSSSCWWLENQGGRGPVLLYSYKACLLTNLVTATIRYDRAAPNLCGDDVLSETVVPLILIHSRSCNARTTAARRLPVKEAACLRHGGRTRTRAEQRLPDQSRDGTAGSRIFSGDGNPAASGGGFTRTAAAGKGQMDGPPTSCKGASAHAPPTCLKATCAFSFQDPDFRGKGCGALSWLTKASSFTYFYLWFLLALVQRERRIFGSCSYHACILIGALA